MKTAILTVSLFVIGFVSGVIVTGLVGSKSEDLEGIQSIGEQNPSIDWAAERALLEARIQSQESKIAALKEELVNARDRADAVAVEAPPLTDEERRKRVEERMAERLERRLNSRIDRMVTKYGLDGQQRLAIKELFLKLNENQYARRSGQEVEPLNLDQELSKIMTGEQFGQYMEETQQDIYNRSEMLATTQTVRISQNTNLDEETLSRVYDTLNVTAQEMMISRQEGIDFDMRAVLEERFGDFLTPEQLQQVQETVDRGPGPGRGRRGDWSLPGP